MLNFSFFMPTRIIHGHKVVNDHQAELAKLGSHALVVTGPTSGKKSGALDDVSQALEGSNISFELFDQVENNPSLDNVTVGGELARQIKPDFIIAIGGGSPLDAAKAIAVLATNDIPATDLYSGGFANQPLPIVAIPTTSGTGSEVTPYSVLTLPAEQTKKGFGSPSLFPRIALLDPRYSASLPISITVDTAVDALSHLVEGYLSVRASSASDLFAEQGIRLFGQCLPGLQQGDLDLAARDRLLIASTLGGITISHTGTTYLHSLGYPLTFFHEVPHGRANGVLFAAYLRVIADTAPARVQNVLNWLNFYSLDQCCQVFDRLFSDNRLKLTSEQIQQYAATALTTKNVKNSLGRTTQGVLANILQTSLG